MAKNKISKSELKLKEMQYAWKIAHYKPKKIVLRRNAIDELSLNLKEHENQKDIENQSQKMKIQEMIKVINKLSDKYPPSVSNSNQKIWRPW
ncbi:MAG: hypothetical protein PPFGHCPK_01510 (plasmid) [Spiroplasma endosymbiont of Drosophila atripex]|nr:MAG: hypothetical protein PPFGHCPK_01510 [Spiroplasma endosymbiont of Drosophila atripex]